MIASLGLILNGSSLLRINILIPRFLNPRAIFNEIYSVQKHVELVCVSTRKRQSVRTILFRFLLSLEY